ncbi:hypothetical protein MGWOODY_Smn2363 [hydrothermal vent metagenome]|uniref:Uncharacterized protein n=1 Tax=hydrothermal vent metagenome TaxID=652676 RepID=A0A160TRP4_9ZZZZ
MGLAEWIPESRERVAVDRWPDRPYPRASLGSSHLLRAGPSSTYSDMRSRIVRGDGSGACASPARPTM